MRDIDEDSDFEDIKKRGKRREMRDEKIVTDEDSDIRRHQEEGKGERNERY